MTRPTAPPSDAAGEGAARAPQGPLAAPIKLEGPGPRTLAWLRLVAFLAALTGHAAVLYWATREPPDLMAGGHGLLLDAVDVTMVDSSVFESRQNLPLPPAPAAAGAVAANEGAAESKPVPPRPEQKEEKAEEKKKAPDEAAPAEAVVKAPVKAPEPPQEQKKERKEASTAADPFGGVSARAKEPSTAKAKAAPAAASPGAVRAYGNAVARALARSRPKRCRGRGTAKVKLVVSPDGGLTSLEILKSSGNRRVDDTALEAVRRTKLPEPPPGLAFKERWYEFTYTCRN